MTDDGDRRVAQAVRFVWTVRRHGGRASDEWREVGRGTEATCRRVYAALHQAMRQGGVELVDPDGTVVESGWAPRLRTRW